MASKESITDQIKRLLSEPPKDFSSDDETDDTRAKLTEKYDESDSDEPVLTSSIRKQNTTLLDEVDDRYKGQKVSRKDIFGGQDSEDDFDDNNDTSESVTEDENESLDEDEEIQDTHTRESDDDSEEESNSEENSTDDDEVDDTNPLYRNREVDNFKSMTVSNVKSDIEKGNCVRIQQKLYDNCVEMRILLQKCLMTSNKMPQFDVHQQFSDNEQFSKSTEEVKDKLSNLLDNLLTVQEQLLTNYPETKKLFNKTQKQRENTKESDEMDSMDEEISSDTEDEGEANKKDQSDEETTVEPARKKRKMTLVQYEKILNENHKKFTPYRNTVIQKWNDKTRIASGKMTKAVSQPVVKQIEFIMSDKTKIIRKSQLKRSDYEIIGKSSLPQTDVDEHRVHEYDAEIYDDTDFYHQILKELIEHKSSDITDPVQLSKQWIQLQNMRSKMKKKVDTKATKGRKIRYNIHNKLVNFMAPITYNDTWSDEAKTELYNSLFGKFEIIDNHSQTDNENQMTIIQSK